SGARSSGARSSGAVFVVAHGFTNSTAKPSTRAVLQGLARFGDVVALDFRGHGRSGGRATVGRDEVLDLAAAVRVARSPADRRAAWSPEPVDSVVAVSSPSRWFVRDSRPMRRVHWLLEHPLGPAVGRVLGVRLDAPWTDIPLTPLEVVDRIAPTPLLLVHG